MQPYSSFEEKGYLVEALTPNSDDDPIAFEIQISVGGTLKKSLLLELMHVPVFGVDVGDLYSLESFAERMMAVLPDGGAFNEETSVALDALESEFGGGRLRATMAQKNRQVSNVAGDFQYTAELFVNRFADLLGGKSAMEVWMKTQAAELGGHTPEDALRLGMVHEVLAYLTKAKE